MEVKLKVGLIDDEPSSLKKISKILSQFSDYELVFFTSNPTEGLLKAELGEIDILITDVMMPILGGLEISERLKECGIPVILYSGHDNFAVSGFQLDVAYFILKPATFKEVQIGLERAKRKLKSPLNEDCVITKDLRIINSKGGVSGEVINLMEINYIEQSGNYTKIIFENRVSIIVSSLTGTIEKLKSPKIVRVHKSYAVSISKIKKIDINELMLYDGVKVPLGRAYTNRIKEIFSKIII
ncbi:response regulator transcription factor [Algoriphagus aestuarii]|nr:response regulator transcription factor [Algoriphagus aestuarii]